MYALSPYHELLWGRNPKGWTMISINIEFEENHWYVSNVLKHKCTYKNVDLLRLRYRKDINPIFRTDIVLIEILACAKFENNRLFILNFMRVLIPWGMIPKGVVFYTSFRNGRNIGICNEILPSHFLSVYFIQNFHSLWVSSVPIYSIFISDLGFLEILEYVKFEGNRTPFPHFTNVAIIYREGGPDSVYFSTFPSTDTNFKFSTTVLFILYIFFKNLKPHENWFGVPYLKKKY